MKTKKTAVTTTWQSPSDVMDTLYDVREPGCDGVGFALLRPRAKQKANSVAALFGAKLAPIKPAASTPTTPCGMPVTARDHRVLLARGVADTVLTRLLDDYDAASHVIQTGTQADDGSAPADGIVLLSVSVPRASRQGSTDDADPTRRGLGAAPRRERRSDPSRSSGPSITALRRMAYLHGACAADRRSARRARGEG